MILESDVKLDFSDVLLRPKRSTLVSRKEFNLKRKLKTKWSDKEFEFVPIIAANMATGTFAMAKQFLRNDMLVAIHKFHTKEQWFEQKKDVLKHCIYTIGMDDGEYNQFKEVRKRLHADGKVSKEDLMLCIDIANGYTKRFSDFVNKIRQENMSTIIIAGNVCTPEMVQELVLAGADFVKVGIGPGSACYDQNENWGWLPAAERGDRVFRCGSWFGCRDYFGRRHANSWGCR